MKLKGATIHFRIDEETKKKLQEKAREENRTLSNYIVTKLVSEVENGR